MKDTPKDLWRARWLSSINELTSIELQKNSWLDKNTTNPHWSFVEFMCSYFDDLAIDNNYREQLKKSWISEIEYETIRNWHIALDNYESPTNDDDRVTILNDKNWLNIIDLGLKAKLELSHLLTVDELKILNEEIDYLMFK